MWTWILINYLVILSWRYLIWDRIDDSILEVWTTFLFLIFNTGLAVITSLVYKSRTLLLFSFIFALLNPLLIWWGLGDSYTVLWYSLIVTFGWLYLSTKHKDIILAIWVFILSNILFLVADTWTNMEWIIKLISSTIVSISTIFVIYKLDSKQLSGIFLWSYIFLILLLGTWDSYIKETTSFISYMITIMLYFGLWIYYFLRTSFDSILFILLAPILIILWLSFTWGLVSIISSLAIIVLIYLFWFNLIKDKLPNIFKYFFFAILWIYIFLTNSFISLQSLNLDLASFITVLIVSFIFIFSSYYLSTKKDLWFLYSIWTIWWILTLAPILITKTVGNNAAFLNTMDDWINIDTTSIFYLSIIALVIFAISNWILPFINKNLLDKKENLVNLVIWMISWLLFLWFELFNYWNIHFPWVTLWFTFAALAIIYFIMAYMMMDKIWIDKVKKDDSSKNVIYSYIWISISVFSLAIALIFSNYDSIVSAVWLFEATIMFYFFYKTKESKIFAAWIILFMIWVFKLFNLIDLVNSKDYIFLIPFTLVFISLVLNIKFLDSVKSIEKRVFHDILHILWIWTLAILLAEIIPSTWHGWSILWITIFIAIANLVYSYFNSNILKVFFIISFTWFLILQIWELDYTLYKIDWKNLEHLRVLQYISTAILWTSVILWNKINKSKWFNSTINIIFSIYLLIITSLYVYDIFDTTFAVTIYWWVTASILLFYGLSKDIIKLRTIWLYIVSLTALKIFLYDIWFGIDDAISRVVALIVIWILFIIISTRYTKKYWNNINKEFSIKNLTNEKSKYSPDKKIVKPNKKPEIKKQVTEKTNLINKEIENIDVWNISSVQFIFKDETINIRAVNLVKIVKMVTDWYWKTKFYKYELKEIYSYIKNNYKSELSKTNYDKIISIIERFIKEWWEVKLVEK